MTENESSSPGKGRMMLKEESKSRRRIDSSAGPNKSTGFISRIHSLFKNKKITVLDERQGLVQALKEDPENTKARLKLAEIYQRNGEKEKSTSEYLKAADIFSKKGFYPQAMALYKQILRQNPVADEAGVKVADIYRRMGFLGDALAQYQSLLTQYDRLGLKEKTQEILSIIKEMDPPKDLSLLPPDLKFSPSPPPAGLPRSGRREAPAPKSGVYFDLGAELENKGTFELRGDKEVSTEKFAGFREILSELKDSGAPSKVYPDFNYQMGVTCHEMGFLDEAVEQLRLAVERGQSPFEAGYLLGICYKGKNWWQEACDSFQQALGVDGISAEQRMKVKKELEFASEEQRKTEQTLALAAGKKSGNPELQERIERRNDPANRPEDSRE